MCTILGRWSYLFQFGTASLYLRGPSKRKMSTNRYYAIVIILAFVKCTTGSYETQIVVKDGEKTINTNVPISEESTDFLDLITQSSMWIDKSNLIDVIVKSQRKIFVITAPKKWGKSINLSMLKLYFETPVDSEGNLIPLDTSNAHRYFVHRQIPPKSSTPNKIQTIPIECLPLISKDLKVTEENLGKFPVIYLDLNGLNVTLDGYSFREKLIAAFEPFSKLLNKRWTLMSESKNDSSVDQFNKDKFNKIVKAEVPMNQMVDSIKFLCGLLHHYYQKKVVLLIDGYDSLVEEYYLNPNVTLDKPKENGMTSFYWSFMTHTLKDNDDLHKAVLSGIFKLVWNIGVKPKEIEEYDVGFMKNLYPFYGITAGEVSDLVQKRGIKDNLKKEAIKWYGGHTNINDTSQVIFSTHSIVKFINSKAVKKYWINPEAAKFIFTWLSDNNFADDVTRMKKFETFPFSEKGVSFEAFYRLKKAILHEKVSDKEYDTILVVLHQLGYLAAIREISPTMYEGEPPAKALYFKVPNNEISAALQELLKAREKKDD